MRKKPAGFRLFTLLCAWVLLSVGAVCAAPATPGVPTLSTDQLQRGMKGYGKTVFYGNRVDTFAVEVLGVLEDVMPDQDLILIRADKPILRKTKIMSGMSGSPIYVDGRLIGALAYSWPFEKEPIAGVTPIQNILDTPPGTGSGPGGTLEAIQTPIIARGFRGDLHDALEDRFRERGINARFMTGGRTAGSSPGARGGSDVLEGGSAVGIQLMRGDLGLTAIGTVTHRSGDQIYAFGHPFLNAGRVDLPMTTATVHTPMPSLRSSFKLASPDRTVGTIHQDRQAAVAGTLGPRPDMIPVELDLRVPSRDVRETYRVEVVRNRFLTPGLINMAAANFATAKINQIGINRLQTDINVRLRDAPNLRFRRSTLVSGSFDPWAFLPLAQLWSNRFEPPDVRSVRVRLALVPRQESASIRDVWVARQSVEPGQPLTVFVRLDPFRGNPEIKSFTIPVPDRLPGPQIRISAVPAAQLQQLEAEPETFHQLVHRLNNQKSNHSLAVVLESSEASLKASGHRMENLPGTVMGALETAEESTVSRQPSSRVITEKTPWVLSGGGSVLIPVQAP